jgi:hypothetical protein
MMYYKTSVNSFNILRFETIFQIETQEIERKLTLISGYV